MVELYREIERAHPDVFVIYVSTGSWQTARALRSFLDRHGYPRGPLLLTHWGPTQEGWFRSGQRRKREQLRHLFTDLPLLKWLLVGDDSQHDPSLYAEAMEAAPEKVLGIAIRQLSATQQVIRHGTSGPIDAHEHTNELPGNPVCAPDGFGIREGLRARGLIPSTGER